MADIDILSAKRKAKSLRGKGPQITRIAQIGRERLSA
jgi:hypothetical protein